MLLDLITFNIRNSDDKDGHSIDERAPRLFPLIKRSSPDVIGMQESMPKWHKYIDEALGDEYAVFDMPRSSHDVESIPLLYKKSRFDCKKAFHFWLSDTPDVESRGWDELFNCYRICMGAVLRDKETGTEFAYLNIHYGFGDAGQVKSDELTVERMNALGVPYIISGDFNMQPEKAGYIKMTELMTDANAVTAEDWGTTFHGYDAGHTGDHIDYCFISRGVKAVSSELIRDTENDKYPSDHYGLHTIVEI
ncbi:MAG: endonuclease/exonuclease/phosphatase family protein [Clostridia bacterium]|nr:endonuclease/exonuclease/phosphatase family protein [Clostridia bacterium]